MFAQDTPVTIWRYVITHDAGTAPNFERPSATLAICKPKIRKGARVGDLVVAFAGKRLGHNPDTVIWAGKVSEKIELGDYWNDVRFASKRPGRSEKPDNIYRRNGKGRLVQVKNSSHAERDIRRDVGGQYTLVFKRAWRLDPKSSELPRQFGELRLGPRHRRGHRKVDVNDRAAQDLIAWLKSRALTVRQLSSALEAACSPAARKNNVRSKAC